MMTSSAVLVSRNCNKGTPPNGPVSYPLHTKAANCTVVKLQPDEPDFSQTIHPNYPSDMNTQRETFFRGRFQLHRSASMAEEPYAHVHPPEVDAQAFSCPGQVYATDPRYDVHSLPSSYVPRDALSAVGNDMAEVSFGCVPQGVCVPLARQEYVDHHGGYLVCPPTSHHSTSNLPNWMYPNTPSPSYSYHSNLFLPPSLYQMVYPPHLVFGVMQPRMVTPVNEEVNYTTASNLPRSDRRSLPSFAPASNENATRPPPHKFHQGTTREQTTRGIEAKASTTKFLSTEDVPPHSRISCVNDRVLTKFKTTKGEQLKIKDIGGHMLAFCLDQAGSRFIQEQLAQSTTQEIDAVHEELAPHALTLMRDVFGNYIVQILLQNGAQRYRHALAKICKENTLALSLHVYGCRVIQKALEVLDFQLRSEIIQKLDAHVIRCIKDMNGNHVIQKAIREFDLEDIPFVSRAVHDRLVSFSAHPYGCRVVQRVLERESRSREQQKMKQQIMETIVENMAELSQDIYGNYVAQHLLRYSTESLRRLAIESLMTAPIDFACHKYASNVLEKALLYSDAEERSTIMLTIVHAPHRGEKGDALCMLTTNRYGNYVVQKMLDVAEDEMKCLIVSTIGERMKSLKKFKFGKHIIAKVEKMISQPIETEDGSEEGSYSVSSVA